MKRLPVGASIAAFVIAAFFGPAVAGTLDGVVLGRASNPKPYVRLEIQGPENRTTFTDRDGRFTVKLRDGRYTIRVIESGRYMEFTADVPGRATETFRLEW